MQNSEKQETGREREREHVTGGACDQADQSAVKMAAAVATTGEKLVICSG
jgi:hypothetical protein